MTIKHYYEPMNFWRVAVEICWELHPQSLSDTDSKTLNRLQTRNREALDSLDSM